MLVDLSKKELEYLLECLNFHYSESDHKEYYMDVNSELCVNFIILVKFAHVRKMRYNE